MMETIKETNNILRNLVWFIPYNKSEIKNKAMPSQKKGK